MARLPEGTITFMLTDLQGSTQAWEKLPKAMRAAMAKHDAILARAVRDNAGELVEAGREGDSVLAVFRTAASAASCALEVQKNFATESWPDGLDMRVRLALHTGEAQLRDDHYFGPALNRCARLLASCHPGQILLTKATESMLADELPESSELLDLGSHRLKDLARPEQVFQLNDLTHPSEFPRIQSSPQHQTNMPHYLTAFVGRDGDLSALKPLLAKSRMVTLTGPGGSGKTRLAVELGWACLDVWPGGVWVVDLAHISEASQVGGAAVAALKLPGRGPALDVVTAWLATRRAILILDDCEHLVAACARFCEAILQACPKLTVVATSREILGVPGETRWPVTSMREGDSVQLFEARARLVVADFKVVASNLETVSQICERLDGMPLAIELAAARLGLLTESEILSQLSDRFGLLAGGARTAPERHQTMTATIDWSYRLLTEKEALLFRRLSVFRGGFTLESVQAVCGDQITGGALDCLGGLVQKSMVVAERAEDSSSRYRLLESQLDYAEDRLQESGELELVRKRHYQHFLDGLVARTRNPALSRPPPGPVESRWIARESTNLWAAMGWARDNAADLGLTFAAYLSRIPFGDVAQARTLLTDVLEHSAEKGLPRVYALRSAASLAHIQGDSEAAVRAAEAALALARELGDLEVLAYTLTFTAVAHEMLGEFDTAIEMYEEANSHLRDSGNRPLLTQIRTNLAWLGFLKGDHIGARDILLECAVTARVEGDLILRASCLNSLGWVHLGLHDGPAARASFKEALAIARSFMDKQDLIEAIQGLLCVAGVSGNHQRALSLAGAANRLSGDWSVRSASWPETQTEESQLRSRSRLGPSKSEQAWKVGWAMTLDEAIDYALDESEPEPGIDAGPLSRREREVATLIASGLTNRQIAERLFIAERSAEGHVERIRNKLGVRSRTEVATWAVVHGLVAPPTKERGTPRGSPSSRQRRPS
ncbi:MAG TPA: LuxR C-terminal-related transcriptional regulator [Candidatus Micrarchaeaceae archaeon]|nr:LuxR C-terminal-related transcriptional regulator [Candidatus Micrarchaeaceae archaeon]